MSGELSLFRLQYTDMLWAFKYLSCSRIAACRTRAQVQQVSPAMKDIGRNNSEHLVLMNSMAGMIHEFAGTASVQAFKIPNT